MKITIKNLALNSSPLNPNLILNLNPSRQFA